jgi:CBS domain-containing protein/GNAT superfamily N-acetyltransferase
MTPNAVTIDAYAPVQQAYYLMREHRIRRLPVVHEGELIGILTISDIRSLAPMGSLSIFQHNKLVGETPVNRLMRPNPIVIGPNEMVSEAARLLLKHRIGGLPVVENDKLIGVISEADIFRLMVANTWQATPSTSADSAGRETIILNNETEVAIRPIRPDDAPRLQDSFVRMSAQTIYDRFLGFRKGLPDPDARYLTNLDYERHMALVATIDLDGEDTIIGVARYHVLDDDPDCAEFAIVIADSFQRQGLGSWLMKRLLEYAQQRGLRSLLGLTHLHNNRLLRFVQRSGLPVTHRFQDGLREVKIALQGEPYILLTKSDSDAVTRI